MCYLYGYSSLVSDKIISDSVYRITHPIHQGLLLFWMFFFLRTVRLSNKFVGQGNVKVIEIFSKDVLWSVRGSYQTIWMSPLPNVTRYSGWWSYKVTPSIDQALYLLLIWTLLPNLTFYLILQGFHRTFATCIAGQQRTLTPLDTWSCPTLGLAMYRPISPELVLFLDFWDSNIPWYFCFALEILWQKCHFFAF